MRVLIYIEPHPIRGTLFHFDNILRKFLPILRGKTGVDVKLFANDSTFKRLGEAEFTPHTAHFLRSLPQEEVMFSQYQDLTWDNDGIAAWRNLIAGTGALTEGYLDLLRRIWNTYPFDVIVHWGENGAISRFLEERPVDRVAMELGCTRSPFFDSLVMDPYGTNGAGVVPKLGVDQLAQIVRNKPMGADEALQSFCVDVAKNIYSKCYEPLPELIARSPQERIAYLPLQLFDDANLLRFSPYDTLIDVVQAVVPRLVDAGYTVVVKPHPASRHRKGSNAANNLALASLRQWSKKIIWCDELVNISNIRLFSRCDLVVTVNSSVGFESLFFDKPVVVLGDAVYKPTGLFPTLDEFLNGRFDRKEYEFNVGILRKFFLGGYLVPDGICEDANAFADRLALIRGYQAISGHDPFEYAENYWRACSPPQLAQARSLFYFGGQMPSRVDAVGALHSPGEGGVSTTTAGAAEKAQTEVLTKVAQRIYLLWCEDRVDSTLSWIKQLVRSEEGRRQLIAAAMFDLSMTNGGADPSVGEKAFGRLMATSTDELVEWVAENPVPSEDAAVRSLAKAFRNLVEECTGPDDSESFALWLESKWSDTLERSRILTSARIVDTDYYVRTYSDVRSQGVDPVNHYCRHGIDEGRSPAQHVPAMTSTGMLEALKAVIERPQQHWGVPKQTLLDEQARSRLQQLTAIGKQLAGSSNKIAVVAHLYYTDLVADLLDKLKAIVEPFDLIITLPDFGNANLVKMVQEAFPRAIFYSTVNRGRDIAPFLDVLPALIAKGYDAVLKVQTKRGYYRQGRLIAEFGRAWREDSYGALLGGEKRVLDIISAFRSREQLTMVGPEPFLISLRKYPYHDSGVFAERYFPGEDPSNGRFFAGTMFWFRPSCLKPLESLNMTDFGPETGTNDGALAHLVERAFGQAAGLCGGRMAAAPVNGDLPLRFNPRTRVTSLDDYFSARKTNRI